MKLKIINRQQYKNIFKSKKLGSLDMLLRNGVYTRCAVKGSTLYILEDVVLWNLKVLNPTFFLK
jgi:hypothetical protein